MTSEDTSAMPGHVYTLITQTEKGNCKYLEAIRNAVVVELLFSTGASRYRCKKHHENNPARLPPHIKYIQTLLGQSSITTTQIYTQVNLEKQKRILTEMHPDIRYIEFIEFNLSLRAYNRQLTDSCLLIEMIRESK
jgi:hypothetical protein